MTKAQARTSEEAAVAERGVALRKFWLDSIALAESHGLPRREVLTIMLATASASVGHEFSADGALLFLGDQVEFFRRVVAERDKALAEATSTSRH